MTRTSGLLTLSTAAVLAASGCAATAGMSSGAGHTVTYKVTGKHTHKASSVTFDDGGVQQTQDTNAHLPYKKKIKATKGTVILYQVLAQNASMKKNTSITCKILVDGKLVKKNTSHGPAAIAHCTYQPGN